MKAKYILTLAICLILVSMWGHANSVSKQTLQNIRTEEGLPLDGSTGVANGQVDIVNTAQSAPFFEIGITQECDVVKGVVKSGDALECASFVDFRSELEDEIYCAKLKKTFWNENDVDFVCPPGNFLMTYSTPRRDVAYLVCCGPTKNEGWAPSVRNGGGITQI